MPSPMKRKTYLGAAAVCSVSAESCWAVGWEGTDAGGVAWPAGVLPQPASMPVSVAAARVRARERLSFISNFLHSMSYR